jgi:hypothetical protein
MSGVGGADHPRAVWRPSSGNTRRPTMSYGGLATVGVTGRVDRFLHGLANKAGQSVFAAFVGCVGTGFRSRVGGRGMSGEPVERRRIRPRLSQNRSAFFDHGRGLVEAVLVVIGALLGTVDVAGLAVESGLGPVGRQFLVDGVDRVPCRLLAVVARTGTVAVG